MAKRKKAAEPQITDTQNHNHAETSDLATEFDPAKLEAAQPNSANTAERIAAAMAAAPVVRDSELETTAAEPSQKSAESTQGAGQFSSKLPDPHCIEQISLTAEKNGPMIRLFRNQKFRSIAIKFDDKPPAEITQQLRDNGWSWHGQDKVWVKPLERGNEWRTVTDAEKQFRAIANKLRGALGLEPVAQLGVGAA
jgi:hypothetical protein